MSVSVGDSNILPSPKVRDLGVIFDECLTLDANISNICRSAHFHFRNIRRIRMLLSFEAFVTANSCSNDHYFKLL